MLLDMTELKQKFNLEDYPVSISGNGSIATITLANHNFKTGNYLNITGTTNYNGLKLVTRISPTQLTFSSSANTTESGIIKQYDSLITKMMNQVDDLIAQECSLRYGDTSEKTETLDLLYNGYILPTRGRITEEDIVSIKLSRENNFTDSSKYITLSESDFYVYEDRIELKFEVCSEYLNCKKAVRITYTTQEAPEGLKSIAEGMFEFYFRIWNEKSLTQKSRSTDGDQVTFRDEIPSFLNQLSPYKRIMIGDPF